MPRILAKLIHFLIPDTTRVSHAEKLISAVGGFVGILLIFVISYFSLGPQGAPWIVASMGASAVLLFAVPHGQLSQPWALIGGHVLSAAIGVSVFRLVPDVFLAAALAVGLAIAAMYYLRCIHPPGGATALAAVLGGADVHALGYAYVLAPVLVNAIIILLTAVVVNYPFRWRRYPAILMHLPQPSEPAPETSEAQTEIGHGDLTYALRELGSYVDITEDDLARIYALAVKHAHAIKLDPDQIRLGHYYSNGRYGDHWSVRQVIDESGEKDPAKSLVIYKVVAGKDRRQTGSCARAEFARWAKYEVVRQENTWLRVTETSLARE
jgi:CBS-domain-containing membrane protein